MLRQLAGRIDLTNEGDGGSLKRDELLALSAVCDAQMQMQEPAIVAAVPAAPEDEGAPDAL